MPLSGIIFLLQRQDEHMTQVLIIEDEPDISDFLSRGLALQGYQVRVANAGRKGLELARTTQPDIVILDLILPDMDGIDVCRELRSESDVAVLMLTARTLVGDRVRGLEAGADDYLPKPFAFDELLARVRAVLRRRSSASEGELRVADLLIDTRGRRVQRGNRHIELTAKEFSLLSLLAQHAGRPLRREFILQQVWGYDFEGETDPVKVYINFLRRKLNAGGEPDLIRTVRDYGYALQGEPHES
jgi:two-component system response regulator MprA